MLARIFFVLLVGFLSASARFHAHAPRNVHIGGSSSLYAKLQARVVPLSVESTTPTRTVSARAVRPAKYSVNKRQENPACAVRISAVISQALPKIHGAVASIATQVNGSSSEDTIVGQVQQDLQGILSALQAVLPEIKNCQSAPTPSGSYGHPPTPPNICHLIIELISCLASIIPTVAKALKSSFFDKAFTDLMSQITDCISQIIFSTDSVLPGTITALKTFGKDLWEVLKSYGYGFDSIVKLVVP